MERPNRESQMMFVRQVCGFIEYHNTGEGEAKAG